LRDLADESNMPEDRIFLSYFVNFSLSKTDSDVAFHCVHGFLLLPPSLSLSAFAGFISFAIRKRHGISPLEERREGRMKEIIY
jgi:hypothetical protein